MILLSVKNIPKAPFSCDKGANSENHIHPCILDYLHELDKIVSIPEVILHSPKTNGGINYKNRYAEQRIETRHSFLTKMRRSSSSTHFALRRFMTIPKHIRFDRIGSTFFGCLNQPGPHLNTFQIMHLSTISIKTRTYHQHSSANS